MGKKHRGGKYASREYVGKKYGRLTVVNIEWPRPKRELRWRVRCDCGTEKFVIPYNVVNGKTKSCGCFREEVLARHGDDLLRYRWEGIVGGCCDPEHPFYKNTGRYGVSICDEWKNSYEAFREWALENGWEEGKCIGRRDTTGDYTPENCVCCTRAELAQVHKAGRTRPVGRARSAERVVVYWGKERRLGDLCEEKGLSLNTVLNRLNRGWTIEDAVDRKFRIRGMGVPARERGLDQAWIVTYYGEKWGLTALCKRKGIRYDTAVNRIKSGMRVEQAVDTPVGPYHRRKPTKKQRKEEEETT